MVELFFFRRLSDVTTFVTPVLPEILEKDVEIKVLKLNHRPRKTLVIIDGVSVRGESRVVFMGFGERKKKMWEVLALGIQQHMIVSFSVNILCT